MFSFRRQLGELDVITERLKARYYSNSGTSSTIITSQNNSIPSTPTITSSNLPLNKTSIRQDYDHIHSTTTIQKHLLEQFPESLNGKPLMSNGLTVTDILSLHNDQVHQAQELMTKANHLLKTSKDFFDKPSIPSELSVSSTAIEKNSTTTSTPTALPNFNVTNECQAKDNFSQININHEHIK